MRQVKESKQKTPNSKRAPDSDEADEEEDRDVKMEDASAMDADDNKPEADDKSIATRQLQYQVEQKLSEHTRKLIAKDRCSM